MSVRMLKSFVLFVLFSFPGVLTISEEMQELANSLHATCVEETGATEEGIENARKGNFVDDDKLKCYMKCLLDQMAVMEDDGVIDVEAAIAVIPEELQEKSVPVIRKCGTKIGVNACDNAFLTNKCWFSEAPNDYFLV